MELFLDCLPCVLRQVLEASRMSTEDIRLHHEIISEAIGIINQYRAYSNAPELCRETQRIVIEKTGEYDPYRQIKQRDIQTALRIYPMLKQYLRGNGGIYWALKTAAIGNVLDSAVGAGCDIEKNIEAELKKSFAVCDADLFERRLKTAKSILVIADNAGETVFDRVLLEELLHPNVTYAVRSAPALNDATEEYAKAAGLAEYARIISTGCDVPGVLLKECGEEFLDIFYNADIVISKGQGNYETLSECGRDVYFLLKAKCPVISRLLGVDLNEYVFRYRDCIGDK